MSITVHNKHPTFVVVHYNQDMTPATSCPYSGDELENGEEPTLTGIAKLYLEGCEYENGDYIHVGKINTGQWKRYRLIKSMVEVVNG